MVKRSKKVTDEEAPAAEEATVAASVAKRKGKRKLGAGGAGGVGAVDPVEQPLAVEATAVVLAGDVVAEPTPKKKRKRGAKWAAAGDAASTTGSQQVAAATDAAVASTSAQESTVETTVFVDGVPYDWEEMDIKRFFGLCGQVESIRAARWQDSGRLRGYAHVSFADEASCKAALALNGSQVGRAKRYLKIEPAKGRREVTTPTMIDTTNQRRLFVKNLPYDTSEAEVGDLFKKAGKIREIRIPTSYGRIKGFAYIEFAHSAGLKAAVSMSPAPALRGRQLRLDVDSGDGPKQGFHYRKEAFESKFKPAKSKKPQAKGEGGEPAKSKRPSAKGEGKEKKLSLF